MRMAQQILRGTSEDLASVKQHAKKRHVQYQSALSLNDRLTSQLRLALDEKERLLETLSGQREAFQNELSDQQERYENRLRSVQGELDRQLEQARRLERSFLESQSSFEEERNGHLRKEAHAQSVAQENESLRQRVQGLLEQTRELEQEKEFLLRRNEQLESEHSGMLQRMRTLETDSKTTMDSVQRVKSEWANKVKEANRRCVELMDENRQLKTQLRFQRAAKLSTKQPALSTHRHDTAEHQGRRRGTERQQQQYQQRQEEGSEGEPSLPSSPKQRDLERERKEHEQRIQKLQYRRQERKKTTLRDRREGKRGVRRPESNPPPLPFAGSQYEEEEDEEDVEEDVEEEDSISFGSVSTSSSSL